MVRISTSPKFIRNISSAKRNIIGQHRVAQQRKFLAQRKKLQLQQFRSNQKLDLFKRRRRIAQQKQLMQRIGQQRRAKQMRSVKKSLGGLGIRW